LGREDKDAYWNEMFYAYGRPGARAADMRANAVGSDYQQFLMPLNHRAVSGSLGVVVHNAYAASQLEGAFDLPVEIIPHHLSPKAYELDRMDKAECRRGLGIPDDAWVIASFGFVTQSKRIPTVLAAFKQLLRHVPNAMFLVVGEDHWKWSVAPLIEEMGLQECARLTGYTTERDFFRYLKAVDVVVNLRFPTAGETSGTLIRALGAGLPVIVTDFGQFAELPDDVCLKVPITENEERELYLRLRALTHRQTLRERLGRRAAEWIRGECEISRSAARYLDFVERIVERRKGRVPRGQIAYRIEFKDQPAIELDGDEALDYVNRFYTYDPNAAGYIKLHRRRLIRTMELVPIGAKDKRLLDVSSYLQMPILAKRYGNYGEVAATNWWEGEEREKLMTLHHSTTGEEFSILVKNVDAEHDRFPFPDDHFDVALCCELIEHLREDPMHMLIELNRILKWGGLVIVTTPNITSAFSVQEALAGKSPNIFSMYSLVSPADRHNREYTPTDMRVVLEAAGFKVIELFTENAWHETDEEFLRWLDHTGVPRELRGDNIFAVGRKQSLQIERYPHDLYE
ncbi:MAG: glycosyltransferase, partial [Blastocatellia bacterium]